MGLTRDDVDKLLAPVEKLIYEGVQKRDAVQVASAYSEDAAVVHLGVSAVRGRKAIAAVYEETFKLDVTKMKQEKLAGFDVNNGEYLMRKGLYRMSDEDSWHDYMLLAQRQTDGNYLIILDQY